MNCRRNFIGPHVAYCQEGCEVSGIHQLLICAEDVELSGKAVTALKKDIEVLSDVCPEMGA
jgi:hypothetical protein